MFNDVFWRFGPCIPVEVGGRNGKWSGLVEQIGKLGEVLSFQWIFFKGFLLWDTLRDGGWIVFLSEN